MLGFLKDLLTSAGTDNTSLSKLSMLVGIVVCSLIVLGQAATGTLSADIFAWYASVTVGANTANKAINVFGCKPPADTEPAADRESGE